MKPASTSTETHTASLHDETTLPVQEPTQAESFRLVIKSEHGPACSVPLSENQSIEIGRGHEVDLSIPGDDAMSRTHARIELIQAGVIVHDLGSANGIHIRINESSPVTPGDEIIIGQTLFAVEQIGAG